MARVMAVIFSVCGLLAPSQPALVTDVCVAPVCTCSSHALYNVTVTCNTSDLKSDLRNYIRKPQLVLALSLTDNHATTIPGETFSNLSNLRHLELNIKNLRTWKGNISHQLPWLKTIDIAEEVTFIPPDHVLQCRSLQSVSGVTWSSHCSRCDLVKNKTHGKVTQWSKGRYEVYPESRCRGKRHVVSDVSRNFAKHGFLPLCLLDNKRCLLSEITVIPTHQCWEKANRVLYVEYLLAPFILVMNCLVVVTTLSTESLRKVPSMLLVTNMAASDLFIGVYSLVITCYRHALPYPKFVGVKRYLCPTLGFFWVTGQFVAVLSSFLLTSERYVAIIFSMRPSVNFTPKLCLVCMLGSWTAAMLMASLPLFGIGTYTSTTFCVPIQPVKAIPHSFAYSTSIVSIGFLLYSISLPLYLHIFVHVRRSSHLMGVKRNGKLAKKISLLVVTNFTFFMLPVFVGVLWLFTKTFNNMAVTTREVLVGSLTTICFSTNSFLNPLLYAFRDRRFQIAIKHRLHRIIYRNRVFAQNITYITRRHTQSRAPESSYNIKPFTLSQL